MLIKTFYLLLQLLLAGFYSRCWTCHRAAPASSYKRGTIDPMSAPSLSPTPGSVRRSLSTAGRTPRRVRQLALGGLFLSVFLTLTGCVRLDIALELLEGDQAATQLDIAFQDAAIEAMGYSPTEFWDEAGPEIFTQLPSDATMEPYPESGWTGGRVNIPAAPISSFSSFRDAGIDDLAITREGDFYVFHASSTLSDELADMVADVPAGLAPMVLQMSLTCPGSVVEANGTVTGNRVVWDLTQFTAAEPLTARCGAVAEGGLGHGPDSEFGRWWPVLLAGLGVLAILGLLGYFLRKRSHLERDTVPSNFEDTATWGQSPAEGTWDSQPVAAADSTLPYYAPHEEPVESYQNYQVVTEPGAVPDEVIVEPGVASGEVIVEPGVVLGDSTATTGEFYEERN